MKCLVFNLKLAMLDYESRTGIHLTYDHLSEFTSLSVDTIKSMATRRDYNASLKNIAIIGNALELNPVEFLEWR